MGLRDPLQLTDHMVCLQPEALHVLAMLDGTHSLRDIQTELSRMTGSIVFMEDIEALVGTLDEAYLLHGDRFKEAYESKVARYRKQPRRPCSHAGMSYSADPEALRKELTDFFVQQNGPGLPEYGSDDRRPVGLIAPHIDVRAGGNCFAKAYQSLGSGQSSDVYVIFGTGHAGVEGVFTATNLDFETPLGVVETDRDFVRELGSLLGRDPAAEEILHAAEHVIEFQLIFLQYILSGRHKFTVVPVLCSLSHHMFQQNGPHKEQKRHFDEFCNAVKEVCGRNSRTVCFIASADLDHIGPRYGDSFVPHRGTVKDALEKDRRMLGCLERLDLSGFVQQIAGENDSRRICGFSPITAMFNCMDAREGRLLGLDFAQVDNNNSFVSFTSMIFH
ncbi:MAG: AmmeMemoRadiSam system protein B [Desulfomonile tiedjei]|uniref:AmmeMemoRadiSam system protein B n=1 Tax=Desulfomonile tiedjei TaxID=2358 RepID=A0A9D6V0J9_9BACT|nr:AmmeMemoRadiSam system protein B [Desulfomonile tiedjei]